MSNSRRDFLKKASLSTAGMLLGGAALTAKGKSVINRIYHLDRGYEFLETKLKKCNAEIRRI